MSFDSFATGVLVFLAFAQVVVAIRGLCTGRWQGGIGGDLVYERATEPHAYWREAALTLFTFLLIAAGLLAISRRVEPSPYDLPYGPLIFLALFAPGLIRAVWAGEIVFGSNRWSRRDRPYWVMLLIGLAFVALMAFALADDLSG